MVEIQMTSSFFFDFERFWWVKGARDFIVRFRLIFNLICDFYHS